MRLKRWHAEKVREQYSAFMEEYLREAEEEDVADQVWKGANDPMLFNTNNFHGRQAWEFDSDAGTEEERAEVEGRERLKNRCQHGIQ
ncbi:hypothetical protein ACFX19_044250 [Malus domestica]